MKKRLKNIFLVFIYSITIIACSTTTARTPTRNTGSNAGSNPATTTQANTVVIFTFDGPQNVSVIIYRNNQFQQTIDSGTSSRITVPNGTHTFEAELTSTRTARIDTTRRQLSVNARGSNVNVSITARTIPMEGTRITDFSISNNNTQAVSVAYVNVDWLNVRSSAANRGEANRIDAIPRNTRVEIIERTNTNWVRIRYGNGKTGYVDSSFLSATTSTARPNIPTNLNASNITSSACTLRWNAVSGAVGYYVYWSTSTSGNFTRLQNPSTTTSMNITSMSANSTYYFRVSAYNNGGESQQSSYITVRTS